jgi:hypothetical protein
VADGDYTNHASVQAAESSKVDFYGSWQDSWKPVEYDAHGRSGALSVVRFLTTLSTMSTSVRLANDSLSML